MRLYIKTNGMILGPLEFNRIMQAVAKGRVSYDATVSDDSRPGTPLKKRSVISQRKKRRVGWQSRASLCQMERNKKKHQ